MLLVTDYEQIRPLMNRLLEAGYGYSCLSEPCDPHEEDPEALIDMLRDWGWTGDGAPPAWLRDNFGDPPPVG